MEEEGRGRERRVAEKMTLEKRDVKQKTCGGRIPKKSRLMPDLQETPDL